MDVTGFPAVAELLGLRPDELVSVAEKLPGQAFRARQVRVADLNGTPVDRDHWAGLCPMRPVAEGRGRADDVVRVPAIWADLDAKPGGMETEAAGFDVIADLSVMLGSAPVYVTRTGHGLQPVWAVENGTDVDTMRALSTRFGLLVRKVAQVRGGDADTVSDLARVLRVPGGINHKVPSVPAAVTARTAGGRPLSVAELADALDAYSVPRVAPVAVAAHPTPVDGWRWADVTCGYAHAMIDGWATDAPHARHPWLLSQMIRLTAARRLGCVTETDHAAAVVLLVDRARRLCAENHPVRTLTDREIGDAASWARILVESKTADGCRAELAGHSHPEPADKTDMIEPEADDELWDLHPLLTWCRDHARHRVISPDALLGAALARISAETNPAVHALLPTGRVALNVFTLLLGPSGSGKSRAVTEIDSVWLWNTERIHPSTGEGIIESFVRTVRTKDGPRVVQHRDRAFGVNDEIETIKAIAAREGSTVMSVLRSLWSGSATGMSNRAERGSIGPHKARLSLVIGAQPKLAGWLFDGAALGTLQRFLWFPSTDPRRPDGDHPPAGPIPLSLPGAHDPHAITVADEVTAEIVEDTRGRCVADWATPDDDHDSHAGMQRLRVATILALTEPRFHVTARDWEIAGRITAKSDAIRKRCETLLVTMKQREAAKFATAIALRNVAVKDIEESAAVAKTSKRIVNVCAVPGGATRREIIMRITPGRRPLVDEALDLCVADGVLVTRSAVRKSQPVTVWEVPR